MTSEVDKQPLYPCLVNSKEVDSPRQSQSKAAGKSENLNIRVGL